jgi:hypothetical protein
MEGPGKEASLMLQGQFNFTDTAMKNARGRGRTGMTLRSRDFKSLVSTNSTTWALDCIDSAAIKMRQER